MRQEVTQQAKPQCVLTIHYLSKSFQCMKLPSDELQARVDRHGANHPTGGIGKMIGAARALLALTNKVNPDGREKQCYEWAQLVLHCLDNLLYAAVCNAEYKAESGKTELGAHVMTTAAEMWARVKPAYRAALGHARAAAAGYGEYLAAREAAKHASGSLARTAPLAALTQPVNSMPVHPTVAVRREPPNRIFL